jgi:hypothetical protein
VATLSANACLPAGSPAPSGYYSPTTGFFGGGVGDQVWAILGAVARREVLPDAALERLVEAQLPEGSWEWSKGWGGDTNTTSLAVQALVAGREAVTSTEIVDALKWLDGVQLADGGFPYAPGSGATSDANSTAYVLQALIAAGEEVTGARWSVGGKSAVDRLLALQLPDGRFEWQSGSGASELATLQAIPALLGRHYPATVSSATQVESCEGLYLPSVLRSAESAQ